MMRQNKLLHRRPGYLLLAGLILTAVLILLISDHSEAAMQKTYTVKASGAPYKDKYITNAAYNSKTRQYYMLRSYLELLEKEGGGTLILSKGTYTITNTLYIPSNVIIRLKDGVKLVKGNDTGTTKLSPAKSMFQLIAPSKAGRTAAAAGYNGESGISFLGEGTAILDLNYTKDCTGIVLGHNSRIKIQGITFRNMSGGSFIKLGASEAITLRENIFYNDIASTDGTGYAIAIEVPDALTKAFSYPWSKEDKTVCRDIIIEENTFSKLERGIGSLKYTDKKYHKNISILSNTFTKTASHGVRILNWDSCILKQNSFSDIRNPEGGQKAVLVSGAKNPTITGNEFSRTDRAIQLMPWKNTGNEDSYPITYNSLSESSISAMKENSLKDMGEYIIRYNKTYNEFTLNTEKWELYDPSATQFTVSPSSQPFQNAFLNYSTYNNASRQYYVLRSYLEQLERTGGGTLTLEAGTYEICNALYVPSHVTILLKDGVTIRKTEQTGIDDLVSSKSIFQLAAPSKSKTEGAYSGYNGETDIHIRGEGKAVIDLSYIQDAIGIVLCHNTEVTISGITFQNMYSGHFIELDASRNITIEKNSFLHHKASASGIKEAINLDTPDKNTGGFTAPWTSYDRTPNRDILIQSNTFDDLERAVGTHKYSEGKYHENIQLLDNRISDTASDAIRILNWISPVIKGNEIRKVAGGIGTDRAILASGLKSPVITDNIFIDVPRPIQLMPWRNSREGEEYETTYNEVTSEEMVLMLKNTLIRCGETFIRVNHSINVFDRDTDRYYYHSEDIRQ